jgi:hypothetical protein
MVLGCLVSVSEGIRSPLPRNSVTVAGVQTGFIVSFTVTQRFTNPKPSSVDVSYLVPNNCKICLYETTFRLRGEVIKPRLERKAVAETIFKEATREGRAAILGKNLGNGLVEFRLGNLPANDFCEVEVCCGFVASSSGPNEIFFKFPLDTCTQSGSTHCITDNLSGGFNFSLRNSRPDQISNISSNAAGAFNAADGTYTISKSVNVPALFVQTTHKTGLSSSSYCSGNILCATALLPAATKSAQAGEFVFVVDCSGSMGGSRIEQARFCLDLFIRSLPPNSSFNVVRFGSSFDFLFPTSEPYTKSSAQQGLDAAQAMRANLGGTELLRPLKAVCDKPIAGSGVRQIFVLTDGEVSDTEAVIAVARQAASRNRCFAIGIGSGADAGLVEGIADASGGRSDFVASANDLSKVVISQLELSLQSGLRDATVNIAGHDAIEIAPWPIGVVFPGVATTFFVRDSTPFADAPPLLLSGDLGGSPSEFVIESVADENVKACALALFAFTSLQRLEAAGLRNQEAIDRCIALSIESGVLCSHSAFVGFSEQIYKTNNADVDSDYDECCSASYSDDSSGPPCCGMPSSQYQDMLCASSDSCSSDDDRGIKRKAKARRSSSDEDRGRKRSKARPAYQTCPAPAMAPARSARAPPPASPAAPAQGDLFRRVIDQQEIDGWWPAAGPLLALVQGKLPAFAEAEVGADPKKKNEVIATIVAIAILRKKCGQQQALWKLIERKALDWLQTQGIEPEAPIARMIASLTD